MDKVLVVAKGEETIINDNVAIVTKVSRMPTMIKRGSQYFPTMRIYYKQGKKRGHCDCEVPQERDIEVQFG